MDNLEIIKFLHITEYKQNPPEFNKRLEFLETLNPLSDIETFLNNEENQKLFLNYVNVTFNWVMNSIISNTLDLYDLVNLQTKIELVKQKYKSNMTNHYLNMLYILLSSVTLYYCDKSNDAIAEFNKSIGQIITQSAEWWMNDFRDEYMESKSPLKFIKNSISNCNSCNCGRKE